MKQYYIGIDSGGNLLRMAKVNPKTGEFIGELVSISLDDVRTNSDLSEKIIEAVKKFSSPAETIGLGICAAGNVDENALVIKESPNSRVKEMLTYPFNLKENGYDVTLTNDMKAAVLDSARYGEGKGLDNVCTVTFSEGHNAAVARKGRYVTWAEMGHHIYNPDGDLFCGCGGRGHLEVYVSGKGAATMAKQYFDMTNQLNHPILESVAKRIGINLKRLKPDQIPVLISSLTAKDVYEAYRYHPDQSPQREIKETQIQAIKYSFGVITSFFHPLDIIVCMGGQIKDKDILFCRNGGAIERYYRDPSAQLKTLRKPVILITERQEIGVRGAVVDYLNKQKTRK
jgi:predicted NBD/HSP70 family sugar kinase